MYEHPPDLRTVRTRRKLQHALIALYARHGYEHLTVREVTKLAKVGYTTCYRHYDNLDDLVTEIAMSRVNKLLAQVRQQATIRAEALAWYAWFRANQELCRFYVSLPHVHPTRDAVKDAIVAYFSERYEPRNPDNVPLDFALEHMAEAMCRLHRWFLFHNEQYNVERVAAMHSDVILNGSHHSALKIREEWLKERPGYLSDASS